MKQAPRQLTYAHNHVFVVYQPSIISVLKRVLLIQVLRAKRNDDDVTKAVANDWGYSGNSAVGDYDNGAGYGRGSGYGGDFGGGNGNGYNGEGPCPKCDGEN